MQVGDKWLQDWCSRISGAEAAGAQADDTLALAVAQVLLTGKSSEEAAAELFDVFGDASFEPIQQLLQSRWASPVPTACAMLWGCQGWHLSSCCRAGAQSLEAQPVTGSSCKAACLSMRLKARCSMRNSVWGQCEFGQERWGISLIKVPEDVAAHGL